MKTLNKPIYKKVRTRTNGEVYYTNQVWPPKEIDGVMFLPVVKDMPSMEKKQNVHYVRKDSLEFVK
jgi:hypothetical protein